MLEGPVAILGTGVASPWGTRARHALAGWLLGTVATAPNPLWPTDGWPQGEAGLVPGFDPRKELPDRKAIKLMSREAQLAVLVALEAVGATGLPADLPAHRAGIFGAAGYEVSELGDVLGLMANSRGADGRVDLGRAFTAGREAYNPLAPLKTLPNMALFHVASTLGAQGPHMALGSSPAAGLAALSEAKDALLRGDCDLAVVVGSDAQADPFRAQVMGEAGILPDLPPAEGAAALLLALPSHPLAAGRPRLMAVALGQEPPPGPGPGLGLRWVGTGVAASSALRRVNGGGDAGPSPRTTACICGAAGAPAPATALSAYLGWLGAAEGTMAVALAALLVQHGHQARVSVLVGGLAGDVAAARVEAP